ncbi:MAG: hypothetical protein IJ364_03280 [Oscillospiraceae bacterium]|nr:hypothetical protein [Oscillospiraceae bacterium]
MMKGWKIITAISFAAIVLGAVCIGVGLLTGAEFERVFSTLDQRYQITMYYNWVLDAIEAVKTQI